jgi:predicted AAA+ superfamily ATPase
LIEDEKTLTRELNALREGMNYFQLSKSYLVTAQRDEMVEVAEGQIKVIPMWKWLLA